MYANTWIEKLLKVDQIRSLKLKNLHLQETFDNLISPLSEECSKDVSRILLQIRQISRTQQKIIIDSSLIDMNNNIKIELLKSIDMYEKLIHIESCKDVLQFKAVMSE